MLSSIVNHPRVTTKQKLSVARFLYELGYYHDAYFSLRWTSDINLAKKTPKVFIDTLKALGQIDFANAVKLLKNAKGWVR